MWPFSKGTKSANSYRPTFAFTPASTEIDKFVTLALASGLIGISKLREACAGFDTDRRDEDAVNDLRNHLVAQNALTEWQCEKLRQGKFKGFYLDEYRLLRLLGKTDKLSIYLGQQVSTGKLVTLDITPLAIDPVRDGKIHYTVREFNAEQALKDFDSEGFASYPTPDEFEADILAVRAALREMDNGETGRPIEEFIAEFRRSMTAVNPSSTEITAVLDQLARGPALVRQVIYEVPSELRKRRPAVGVWSAHEHAVHLPDIYPLVVRRLDQMFQDPSQPIKDYEPSRDDPDDALLKLDLDEQMDRFARERAALLERIKLLTPEQWTITVEHTGYSHYGVFIMFRHLALHDLYHAYRIEERLLWKNWK